jgi:hypothetical protein
MNPPHNFPGYFFNTLSKIVLTSTSRSPKWFLPSRFSTKILYALKVSENRVLRIFGPRREVDGSWRKLHNDELHNLYPSPNIIRVIKARRLRWAGHVARMGEGRGAYRILVGRPEGKRPLGRPRHRWEDNIKMDLREIGIDEANWIRLAQDTVHLRAFVNTVMNIRVP